MWYGKKGREMHYLSMILMGLELKWVKMRTGRKTGLAENVCITGPSVVQNGGKKTKLIF